MVEKKLEYNFKILKDVDKNEWNNNLLNSPHVTFFQTYEYLMYESKIEGNTPIFITIQNEDEKVVGQLGLIVYKKLSLYSTQKLRTLFNFFPKNQNRATWAEGPTILSEKQESEKILKQMLKALEKLSVDEKIIVISGYTPHDDFFDTNLINIFKNDQYSITKFFTFMTDLTIEDLWNSLNKNAKRDVTRAKRRNFVIKELDEKNVDNYFKLTRIWAKTKGIEKQHSSELEKDYWEYYQKGREIVFLAYENNELVASHRLGVFNGVVYSHKITNSYSKSGSLGGPLLTWHALEWAKNNQMKFYDFSGGQAPPEDKAKLEQYEKQWKSLLEYKRKWGGKEVGYYNVVRVFKPNSYKIIRIINKIDWALREYKHKKFRRPTSN